MMIPSLVEHVVKQIVEYPQDVKISTNKVDDKTLLEIFVAESDRGKVIGKQGQMIKAIRILVSAVAPEGQKFNVDIAK